MVLRSKLAPIDIPFPPHIRTGAWSSDTKDGLTDIILMGLRQSLPPIGLSEIFGIFQSFLPYIPDSAV